MHSSTLDYYFINDKLDQKAKSFMHDLEEGKMFVYIKKAHVMK